MPLRAERLGLATEPIDTSRKGLWDQTLSHSGADIDGFEDPNLLSSAALVPMPASADRAGRGRSPMTSRWCRSPRLVDCETPVLGLGGWCGCGGGGGGYLRGLWV